MRLLARLPRRRLYVALVVLGLLRLLIEIRRLDACDVRVYQQGGRDVVSGLSVYTDHGGLPFTYTPFAALTFVPLAPLSNAALWMTWLGLNFLALAIVVHVVLQQLSWDVPLVPAMSAACLLCPVTRTFELGQINLVLLALVLLDAFIVPPRWRGMLTGIAAGIKLTPAVLGLYFLVTRQWAAAARATLTGFGTLIVGLCLLPQDSVRYWLTLLWEPSRIGGLDYPDNISILGNAVRIAAWLPHSVAHLLGVAAIAACGFLAHGAWHRRDPLAALCLVGLSSLLDSPVSWAHHAVWLVPILAWALRCGGHERFVLLTLIACAVTPSRLNAAGTVAGFAITLVLMGWAWTLGTAHPARKTTMSAADVTPTGARHATTVVLRPAQ